MLRRMCVTMIVAIGFGIVITTSVQAQEDMDSVIRKVWPFTIFRKQAQDTGRDSGKAVGKDSEKDTGSDSDKGEGKKSEKDTGKDSDEAAEKNQDSTAPEFIVLYHFAKADPQGTFTHSIYDTRKSEYDQRKAQAWLDKINAPGSRFEGRCFSLVLSKWPGETERERVDAALGSLREQLHPSLQYARELRNVPSSQPVETQEQLDDRMNQEADRIQREVERALLGK